MARPVEIAEVQRHLSEANLSAASSQVGATPESPFSFRGRRFSASRPEKVLRPFNSDEIKVLLLENVNKTGIDMLKKKGYQVEALDSSLPEEELIEKIRDVNVIGIRSKTQLRESVLRHAPNLISIGCFCIGTNQVDLEYAAKQGIAVFNSPFSNSRSVAELVIGYIISLSRQLGDRSIELHSGTWNKVSKGCWEIRGKTLGIVGYGHIGSQLSVLAEAMGMQVLYYDVLNIMALGMAHQVDTLEELLGNSDFVSLHVPEVVETHNLMGDAEFAAMRDGSYLINASRGTVVDIPALIKARKSGKLAGFAIDVYPNEPGKNGVGAFNNDLNDWTNEMCGLGNVILTPHIGGSTNEAQRAIGVEVATALSRYVNEGTSVASVNFPEVDLRRPYQEDSGAVRVLYVHQNVPGVLRTVNEIFADYNIEKQFSDSEGNVAYLMADLANVRESDLRKLVTELERTPFNIRTRVLY